MKEIILNYDEDTNNVYTENGFFIGTIPVGNNIKTVEGRIVDKVSIVELVNAGLTSDDIVKLKNGKVI